MRVDGTIELEKDLGSGWNGVDWVRWDLTYTDLRSGLALSGGLRVGLIWSQRLPHSGLPGQESACIQNRQQPLEQWHANLPMFFL
jgi:hypothetical protein